jgi:membrane-associated phospholipid phosphatase
MHVGWSVLIGIFGFRAARRRWLKAFFVAHPFLMVLAVTATGNHYFVDALAGAGAAFVAVALLAALRRVQNRRSNDLDGGGEVIELRPRTRPEEVRRAA